MSARGPRIGEAQRRRLLLAVLHTELVGLLRDRRALFSAFLLPMLLYPLMFLGQSWLERLSRETLEARTVHVALDLRAAPPELDRRLRELLLEQQPIELFDVDARELLSLPSAQEPGRVDAADDEREAVHALCADGCDLLLVARPLPLKPDLGLRPYFDGTSDLGNEARSRVEQALGQLYSELRTHKIEALLVTDPALGLDLEPIDVASIADTSGAALGRLLPLIAVIVLLSGGSYAALSAFAGEREAGTLETLLVQPVPAISIAGAKFVAVLLTGCTTLVLNAGSVLVCLSLGLGTLPSMAPGAAAAGGLVIGAERLLAGALVFLPATILLCAILCFVCGRARTFREGQQTLLPLLFACMLPTLFATQQDIQLDLLLAAVPLAGPSLALRDALRGELHLGMVAWMFVANMFWAGLVVTRLARLIDAEKLLQSGDNEHEAALRKANARGALRWGWMGVFVVYILGGSLQSWNAVWGLFATQWVVLNALTFACARGGARRARASVRETLSLHVPAPQHALSALLFAPALTQLARRLFEWQKHALPLPSSVEKSMLDLPFGELTPLASVLLIAVSPAICEELFFRGAVLSGLRRDLKPALCVLWQALLFGAVHTSIYRFLPTAILGAVLAVLTLRSRSIVPAMLLHMAYNGIFVLTDVWPRLSEPQWSLLAIPAALLWLWGEKHRPTRAA